jgi:hypothetical protein
MFHQTRRDGARLATWARSGPAASWRGALSASLRDALFLALRGQRPAPIACFGTRPRRLCAAAVVDAVDAVGAVGGPRRNATSTRQTISRSGHHDGASTSRSRGDSLSCAHRPAAAATLPLRAASPGGTPCEAADGSRVALHLAAKPSDRTLIARFLAHHHHRIARCSCLRRSRRRTPRSLARGILDVLGIHSHRPRQRRACSSAATASGTKVLTAMPTSRIRELGRSPFSPFGPWACLTRLAWPLKTLKSSGLCGLPTFTDGRLTKPGARTLPLPQASTRC